jgi:hypothetical protein
MLDTNKPIAVIVNGPARTGKTTALQYLRDTHEDVIAVLEPGQALKTHYMINTFAPEKVLGLQDNYAAYLDYMRDTQKYWNKEYEKLKDDEWITRDMMILYAESIRAVYKNFWIDLAAQLMTIEPSTQMIWCEAINETEFFPLKKKLIHLVGLYNIATVRLNCLNPSEIVTGDTRSPVKECKNVISYYLEQSRAVADFIFNNREALTNVG